MNSQHILNCKAINISEKSVNNITDHYRDIRKQMEKIQCSENSINELFTIEIVKFLSHVKLSANDPAVLILNGYLTHTKNLEVINRARENHVTLLTIPPHCSHKLQPLDVSFMSPLDTFYVAAIEKFLRNNPGRVVTQFQVSKLFGEAYLRSATPTTAINGFKMWIISS
ncbi:hypothetical protein ANN_27723 [Periplaneta americana]|uniref:DDE-1 domain-containing protein n=1 Tax=Periplaneta americana TaxID=6978 RepID=A0ABQ8RUY8_PERAM|nr:hypothetical protein ANN_27723 [Periplaneta americana]